MISYEGLLQQALIVQGKQLPHLPFYFSLPSHGIGAWCLRAALAVIVQWITPFKLLFGHGDISATASRGLADFSN